jgi:hypothetical protein
MATVTKPAAKKAVTKAKTEEGVFGYSVKAKAKVLLHDVVITSNGRGSFMAKGQDEDGNNVCAIMSAANAEAAVENGWAEYGEEPNKAAPAKKVAKK